MNFEHTSLLQHPQQPPKVYSEGGGGGCNSSESSAMLLDAEHHHRVVSCGQQQQQRGGLLSEHQQQQMGHNNSLYDWDINDPDIPAKVHLYVSTNLFCLTYKMKWSFCTLAIRCSNIVSVLTKVLILFRFTGMHFRGAFLPWCCWVIKALVIMSY